MSEYEPLPEIPSPDCSDYIISPYATETESEKKKGGEPADRQSKIVLEKYDDKDKKPGADTKKGPDITLASKLEESILKPSDDRIRDELYDACFKGELTTIKRILDEHYIRLMPDANGQTPLYAACVGNQKDVIQCLVEYGYDVNHQDNEGKTPLHVAFECDQGEIAKLLLRRYNANFKLRDKRNWSSFHSAIDKGHFSVASQLIRDFYEQDAGTDVSWIQLLAACHERRMDKVQFLLATKADVNHVSSSGKTPLSLACSQANMELIKCLLENGADPNVLYNNRTVYHRAVLAGNTETLECLLQCPGIDLNKPDHEGDTCLHMAVHKNRCDMVKLLLNQGNIEINYLNHRCSSPLHIAVVKRSTDIIRVLLQSDANVNQQNGNGDTPLHIAIHKRDSMTIKELLGHKADPNARDRDGVTCLLLALIKQCDPQVEELLAAGGDPSVACWTGDNCLHYVVEHRTPSHLSLILQHSTDINAQNNDQRTALFIACARGYRDMVKQLIDAGADLNIVDSKHNSPLHMAIVCDAVDVVGDLIQHGANVNIKGQQSMSPLQTAVQQGSYEALALLLLNKPDVNAQDINGNTSLHMACQIGLTSKIDLLLQNGISVTRRNLSGCTPFEYAVRQHDKTLLELFLKYDSSVLGFTLDSHETALHFYCRKGNVDMCQWLLQNGADINRVCLRGSPLDSALDNGHENIVTLLIDEGAKITRSLADNRLGFLEKVYRQRHLHMSILRHIIMSGQQEIDLTCKNEEGETLFFQACRDEAVEVVQLLLDSKYDIGINIPNRFGKTPVSIVCELSANEDNDAVQILSMLLQNQRKADVDHADMHHMTPLHIACQNSNMMLTNMLLRTSKASINSTDTMDRTPLHFAKTTALVELLVSFGADLNKRDYLGQTPLLFNCEQGNHEVVTKLLALQPDAINSCDNMRRTVAHHCTAARILHVLYDAQDLHINSLDINQQSALHITVMNDDRQSTEQLLQIAANPNVKDKCNLSPIHMAKSSKCRKLLTKHKANTKVQSVRGCSPDDMMQWHEQIKLNQSMDLQHRLAVGGHAYLKELMAMELVGFIEAHAHYAKEYHNIRNQLKHFMARLSVEVQKVDPMMEFEVMPSGSMNEDTKVSMPNEGDFVCLLIKVSEMLEPPTTFSFQTANVTLNLRPDFCGQRPAYVDADGRVVTQLLFHHFYKAVQRALAEPDIWTEFHQLYRAAADDITRLNSKISNVNIMWHGSIFKWMPISVDIVPGILFPSWRPSWCQKRAVLKDTQCCIVAKNIDHAPEDMRPYLFQLGFTEADAEMFRRMSPHLKDGYKLAKLMRMPCICSPMRTKHTKLDQASTFISSYMLKTVTFHLHEEYLKHPEKFNFAADSVPAVEFARRIYEKLRDALRENFLEMYPIPAHDLFRNHFKFNRDADGNVSDYRVAASYCKKILGLLSPNPAATQERDE